MAEGDGAVEKADGIESMEAGEDLDAGGTRTHRKGRVRHTFSILVLVALLAAAFYGSYHRVWGVEKVAGPTPTCTRAVVAAAPTVAADLVYLNVYNASDRGGLGDETARLLKKRHFHIITIGNDPSGRAIVGVGEVRYGPGGKDVANTVAAQVAGVILVEDHRADPSVDLVLGRSFTALVPLPPMAPGSFKLNVYNTTFHPGLAGDTAKELKARGFDIADVGNDPLKSFMTEPGALRFGEDGVPAARRVALQIKGLKLIRDDRKNSSVDLVLGSGFSGLVPTAQATVPPTPTPTTTRAPGC